MSQENKNDKLYIGNGRKHDQYDLINCSICLSDVPPEWIKQSANGKKYLNITVASKREVDKYGKTHSVSINQWSPLDKKRTIKEDMKKEFDTMSDIPF